MGQEKGVVARTSAVKEGHPTETFQERNNLQSSQEGIGELNTRTSLFCYLPISCQPLPLAQPNGKQRARSLVDAVYIDQPPGSTVQGREGRKWIQRSKWKIFSTMDGLAPYATPWALQLLNFLETVFD